MSKTTYTFPLPEERREEAKRNLHMAYMAVRDALSTDFCFEMMLIDESRNVDLEEISYNRAELEDRLYDYRSWRLNMEGDGDWPRELDPKES